MSSCNYSAAPAWIDNRMPAIMGAAYDFRDAYLSGSKKLIRTAHESLEKAVRDALAASPAEQQALIALPASYQSSVLISGDEGCEVTFNFASGDEVDVEVWLIAVTEQAAPKASPSDIAKLRHLYANLKNGGVRDTAQAKRIADGLLAPIIERLEQAAPKTAPVKACVCGEPQAPGTVHRVDGPCYVAAPLQEPTGTTTMEAVAQVVEDLEPDGSGWYSKVRWIYNPVPVGEELYWPQTAPATPDGEPS